MKLITYNFKIKNSNIFISYAITVLFFILSNLLNSNFLFTSIIISISLFVILFFCFDFNNFITPNNIFIVIFFFIGNFIRYLYLLKFPNSYQSFSRTPFLFSPENSILISIVILFISIIYACVKNVSFHNKKFRNKSNTNFLISNKFNYFFFIIIYLFLMFIYFFYRFKNIRLVTQIDYGIFDYIFNLLEQFLYFIALFLFLHYLKYNKIISLVLYLLFFLGITYLSILSSWRGSILYYGVSFLLVFLKYKKISLYLITFFVFGFFFYFYIYSPILSIYRANLAYGYEFYPLNIASLISYYSRTDLLKTFSERLNYFDMISYSLMVSENLKEMYLNNALYIHEKIPIIFLPRFIWPEKPIINSGLYVTHILMGYSTDIYTNISLSSFGEIFINYSFIGIIFLSFVYPLIINLINRVYNSKNLINVAFSVFAFNLLLLSIEGDISPKIVNGFLIIIVFFIFRFLFQSFILS